MKWLVIGLVALNGLAYWLITERGSARLEYEEVVAPNAMNVGRMVLVGEDKLRARKPGAKADAALKAGSAGALPVIVDGLAGEQADSVKAKQVAVQTDNHLKNAAVVNAEKKNDDVAVTVTATLAEPKPEKVLPLVAADQSISKIMCYRSSKVAFSQIEQTETVLKKKGLKYVRLDEVTRLIFKGARVYLGPYGSKAEAQASVATLAAKKIEAYQLKDGNSYKVQTGYFSKLNLAQAFVKKLKTAGVAAKLGQITEKVTASLTFEVKLASVPDPALYARRLGDELGLSFKLHECR